jgi:mRNA interferase MazF
MMRSRYKQGDVVLVRFVYTDESGAKRRPALILSSDEYHQGRQEAIIAAITSNVHRMLVGDHLVKDWQKAGLLYPSVVTGIIRTIKQNMIERRLGEMPATDMQAIQDAVRRVLDI